MVQGRLGFSEGVAHVRSQGAPRPADVCMVLFYESGQQLIRTDQVLVFLLDYLSRRMLSCIRLDA